MKLAQKESAVGYLPHDPPMLFVQWMCEVSEEYIVCETTLDSVFDPFAQEDGSLSSVLFVEIMAQTVGVWAGVRAKKAGGDIQPGLILGCRDFKSSRASWPKGTQLSIRADKIMEDGETAIFDVVMSELGKPGETLASGSLTARLATWEQLNSFLPS